MGVIPNDSRDEGVGETFANIPGPVDKSGFFSNVQAGFKASVAGPGSTKNRQAVFEAPLYDQIVQALSSEGEAGQDFIDVRPGGIGYRGPKDLPTNQFGIGRFPVKRPFRNPYSSAPSVSQSDNPLVRLYLGGDAGEKSAIWEAVKRVRRRKPDFLKDIPDENALAELALKRRSAELSEADEVMSRAGKVGLVGQFLGGMAGSIVAGDPENFAGIGVGSAAAKTVARTVLKRGLQEGAINAAAGALALPGQTREAESLGTEVDVGRQIGEQFAIGAVFGSAGAIAPHVGAKAKELGGKAVERTVDTIAAIPGMADKVAAATLRAGTIKDRNLLREYRRLNSPYDASTPDERAAANIVERDVEVREASPLPTQAEAQNDHRLDAIAANLGVNLAPPKLPATGPVQVPSVPTTGGRRVASYEDGLHHAEGTGRNPDSSADGHFQFIDSTWLEYAPRVTDTKGMSKAKILGLRDDRGIAEAAERLFRTDNARYLRARGAEDSPGNLSLAHFLGRFDAAKVLRASPDTPINQVVDASSIRANPNVFKNIRTAQDMVAWAHRRIGATVDSVPARADAVADYELLDDPDYASIHPYERAIFRADEIETDAALMQYKAGGDEAGVTDKLRMVEAWNPTLSSEVMVWEALDGRRVVVDGHQRVGLAKRLADPDIEIPAIVYREADGLTAQHMRVLGALRNINIGTGTLLDNARVLRDSPDGAAMLQGAERRREIEGLANLSHEAFGAAVNDVIDPEIAAQIGLHAGDKPDTHMALIDLLAKERIKSPKEAAAIVRQAHEDGFGAADSEQLTMFGNMPVEALYTPIARIIDAATKRLREERRTFAVLAEKAGRIEEAGNVLDRTANQGRVISAAEAIGIIDATAYRSGPVRDALIAAARAEISGSRRADAVKQFLDAIEGIDLRAAARGVQEDRLNGEPSGAQGGGDAIQSPDADVPDSLEPSFFEQAVDVAAKAEAFSDPVGQGARDQTALLEHDLRMDADPALVERQAQETQLRADSPLRPGAIDVEGTMGLSLFDAADQPTFRLSDEGDARSIADIMADTEADETAALNAKACLQ